jgi:GT2 family glycosyltransferase
LAAQVDVLIPVYEGREHALACIQSVIEAQSLNQTPHEIIVLDDASDDPVLIAELNQLAQNRRITLVRHPANLGFIRNINRGMALHSSTVRLQSDGADTKQLGRDVLWLNSDTRVMGNWLDRLRELAYASPATASVTPWSNHGEAMSLAGFQVPSHMPTATEQQAIDQVLKYLTLPAQTLVSGCGFCFYIKRQAIDEVGYLDELSLIDGYGEETDWCMRARRLGWQHLGATNVFVAHEGGQSFGARKQLLAKHNNAIIRQRYPLVDRIHDAFRDHDPLQALRVTIEAELKARGIELRLEPATYQDALAQTLTTSQTDVALANLASLPVCHHQDLTKLADGCGLIVDDLRDPDIVNAWLAVARQIRTNDLTLGTSTSTGSGGGGGGGGGSDNLIDDPKLPRLLIGQDTPGSLLLEKTGVAMRIGCPVGLAWSQWLPLLGVTHSVRLASKDLANSPAPRKRQTKTAKKATAKSLARAQRAEQAQAVA